MAKSAKNNFAVKVSGIAGTWSQMTGGGGTVEPIRDRSGGSTKQDIIGSPPSFDDITVTRVFDVAHLPALASLTKALGRSRHTITKQATDANMTAKGKPVSYPNALLVGVVYPEVDSNATTDKAEVTLTFSHNGPA